MRLLNTLSIALALSLAPALPARAATTIKIATIAPDGTAWMKEMRATGDAIKKGTDGRVELEDIPHVEQVQLKVAEELHRLAEPHHDDGT